MSFIAAGEILGNVARVRTLTIAHHPELPDGAYAMVDTNCADPGCDGHPFPCRPCHTSRRAAAGVALGRWRRTPAQPALPLRQRSKARGLLRPGPVISRRHGGSTSAKSLALAHSRSAPGEPSPSSCKPVAMCIQARARLVLSTLKGAPGANPDPQIAANAAPEVRQAATLGRPVAAMGN
jgi:hypothetical protein